MSNLTKFVAREIRNQRELIVGTVVADQTLINFDGSGGAGSGVFVCDVEIGSNNLLRKIPIKAAGNRFYAQRGQTVLLRRNAAGRYEVIGPGDRLSQAVQTVTYDLSTGAGGAPTATGFTFVVRPLEYYATLAGASPSGVIWGDGITPLGVVHILDALGNIVP
jgi:hypothetical protein